MAIPPALLTAIKIASTVASVVGTIRSGAASQQQSNFTAQQLRQEADREGQIAKAEEDDFRRKVRNLESESNSLLGAMGVTSTGSPTFVAEDLAAEAELQALRIRGAGDARQQRLQSEAELERFGGSNTRRSSFMTAAGQGLTGLGKVDFGK